MHELTLWMGTVGQATFPERVTAAAACGYGAISVLPMDCAETRPEDLRTRAEGEGVRVVTLDPITTWIPDWTPEAGWTADPERLGFVAAFDGYTVDQGLALAAALGCASVSVTEPYGKPVPVERGAEAFASMCDRAAEYGLRVELEATPWSGVPDLRTAWSIVSSAGRENAGLVLDTWHFFRSGGDVGLLAIVPAECLSVQLCDGPKDPEEDLFREALDRRRLPGDGDFDLNGIINLLRNKSFCGSIGPEVISTDLRSLDPVESARRAFDSCVALLAAP